MSEAQSRKAVLTAVFKRRGANGRYTRLFDDLDANQKEVLLQNVQLSGDEVAIVGSVQAPDRWLLLTTEKIASRRGGEILTVDVREIIDAVADLQGLARSGGTKLEMRKLQVKTAEGLHTIEIEPGAPLSGIWSVLKNIGARNRGGQPEHEAGSN